MPWERRSAEYAATDRDRRMDEFVAFASLDRRGRWGRGLATWTATNSYPTKIEQATFENRVSAASVPAVVGAISGHRSRAGVPSDGANLRSGTAQETDTIYHAPFKNDLSSLMLYSASRIYLRSVD